MILWILIFLIVLIILIVLASFVGFFYILHRNDYIAVQLPEEHELYADSLAFSAIDKEEWKIKTFDGLSLRAAYLPHEILTNKTVILAHGYNSVRDRNYDIGWLFHSLGYNVLFPEMRASTEAEGRWVGAGWLDKEDFKLWIQLVIEKNPEAEIALWGLSMGGATIMMLSGEELPTNVKCFIEDCGYNSWWEEIGHQLHHYHLPIFPLLNLMSFWSSVFAGYNWHDASSVKQLSKNSRPMFYIHGEEDDFVPYAMLDKNIAANPAIKEVLRVPKAHHAKAYQVETALYRERIKNFLARYF